MSLSRVFPQLNSWKVNDTKTKTKNCGKVRSVFQFQTIVHNKKIEVFFLFIQFCCFFFFFSVVRKKKKTKKTVKKSPFLNNFFLVLRSSRSYCHFSPKSFKKQTFIFLSSKSPPSVTEKYNFEIQNRGRILVEVFLNTIDIF